MTVYEIIVGNLGSVHTGKNKKEALREYSAWVECSLSSYGRVAGEDVTLFADNDIIKEHSKGVSE